MNFLQTWIQTPLAQALGWTLAHFLWEGTLIALLLAGILRLCHPGSARLRYALALTALLAMPVTFVATIALSWPAPQPGTDPVFIRLAPAIPYQTLGVPPPMPARIWSSLPWLTPV